MSDNYALIAQLDEEDLSYEWHTISVIRTLDGVVRYEHDAGCSCDGPLDEWGSRGGPVVVQQLPVIDINNPSSWNSFEEEVNGFPAPYEARAKFLEEVRNAFK